MKIGIGRVLLVAGLTAGLLAAAPVMGDDDTAKKISALLVDKLGDDAKTITVSIVKGEIVMIGEVSERSTAELAKEVALAVPGAPKKIDNQVKPKKAAGLFGGKVKAETEDAKLESSVKGKISDEVGDNIAKAIEIEACDGIVSLRGTAPDATRKDQALKAAKGVKDVKKVIDLITVAGK